jgi:hypothetical protein
VTTPIEITDETRRAVWDEDCQRLGHNFRFEQLLQTENRHPVLRGPVGQLPHLLCDRCSRVWLLVEDSGVDYADAIAKFKAKLKNPDDAKSKPR